MREVKSYLSRNPEPTATGEEGEAHRISLPDGSKVWAKRWYHAHNKGISIPRELGGCVLSPYWARLNQLELEIAHLVGDRHIVEPLDSFDDRVAGNTFDMLAGRPTNINVDAIVNEEISGLLQSIHERYREASADYKAQKRAKGEDIYQDDFFDNLAADHNREVIEIVGEEVSWGTAMRSLDEAFERAASIRARQPENIIPDLVEAGVYPCHPEVNFVPGNQTTHDRAPYGTFIEAKVFDINRATVYLKKKFGLAKFQSEILPKIMEFILLRELDNVYTQSIVSPDTITRDPQKDSMRFDPKVTTAIYNCLEALRVAVEKGRLPLAVLGQIPEQIFKVYLDSSSPEIFEVALNTNLTHAISILARS